MGSFFAGVGNGSRAGGLGEAAAFAARGEPVGATGPPHLSHTRGPIERCAARPNLHVTAMQSAVNLVPGSTGLDICRETSNRVFHFWMGED